MQSKLRKVLRYSLSFLLAIVLLATLIFQMMLYTSGNTRYFSGDAEEYYQSLVRLGFSEDYAVSLTELHLLHPTWTFSPLLISEQDAKHTWSYVIDQETRNESINLISKSNTYSAYWHETNRNQPEAGYYQPSRAAVEYFMDPRNFLNEADIFQFYDLSSNTAANAHAAVTAVLDGTFMEDAKLENGKTYAAYFCEIGNALGIDPVYLAVKIRQEQGVSGNSPIISGSCGSLLNSYYQNQTQQTEAGKDIIPPSSGYTAEQLLALDGYYNYNNIKASGTGVFAIYYNAMLRAREGTPEMSDTWGGSPSWNTRWKSLYGGAYFLKTSYIDRYQSTIYLQKFNVDNRSGRTFWGQYMASIPGALSEGRTLYQSFALIGALDSACHFLIPVYKDMPTDPCADPAMGKVSGTAVATLKYQYQNELTSPTRTSATNSTLYLEHEAAVYSNLTVSGVFTHSYGVKGVEYRWDNEAWQPLSDGKNANVTLPVNFSENSSHILTVRGKAAYDHNDSSKKSNTYFLCAVIYVKVLPPQSVTLTFEVANTKNEQTVLAGSQFVLPVCTAPDFAGWLCSDGSFLPSGAEIIPQNNATYSAIFLGLEELEGAAISFDPNDVHLRFSAILRNDAYEKLIAHGSDSINLYATLSAGGVKSDTVTAITKSEAVGNQLCFDACTPTVLKAEYNTEFSATFVAELHYTNGESATLTASGTDNHRSVLQVAAAALADQAATYSPSAKALFQSILQQN